MSIVISVYVAGLLGILGHWATRRYQSRTTSSFFEYLRVNSAYTFASLSAGFGALSGVTVLITPGMSAQQIIALLGAAYTTTYAIDSKLNKDKPVAENATQNRKVIKVETNEEDIDDVLSRDSKL